MLVQKNGFNFYKFSDSTELTEQEVRTIIFALEKTQEKWRQLSESENCSPKCYAYNKFFEAEISQIKGLFKALYQQTSETEENVVNEITESDIL